MDTGIGISPDKQQIIFDRFIQAEMSLSGNYDGAGLGLSISKAYVDILGGEIWVNSNEGEGTTFCFTVPYDTPSQKGTNAGRIMTGTVVPDNAKNVKVLLVEDDEISGLLMKTLMKKYSSDIILVKDVVISSYLILNVYINQMKK